MVSFRLSPEEYTRFRELCSSNGIGSISALARTAMHRLSAVEIEVDPLSDQVRDIRNQVQALSHELERISRVIENRRAAAGD